MPVLDFSNPQFFASLLTIIMIDLVLAADNSLVIAMAVIAASLLFQKFSFFKKKFAEG